MWLPEPTSSALTLRHRRCHGSDSQRRFDALVAIFRAAVVAPADGVAPKPVVNLLVGLQTFERLSLAEHGR